MTAKSATNIAFSAKIRKSIILPAGFVISALLEIGLSLSSGEIKSKPARESK
jgi:hypothetical protein